MRAGDWAAAWRISDGLLASRKPDPRQPRHEQIVWDGTPLAGRRVLVRCYHGLGDTIQFARFLPRLSAIAREVTVWAQPALLPLLATLPGTGRLLPLHDGTPEGEYEAEVEIMELAHALRITPATLPAAIPYLHPPQAESAADGMTVGLVWRAGDWDPRRSMPPALLAPLARRPGTTLHVLQRGPGLADWPAGVGVQAGTDDVLALATAMRGLHLVISVDSMPAHLAGALGIPVWTMLAADADWRWMHGRDDSPWYPTMRLFRQPRPGDWESVVDAVSAALAQLRPGRCRNSR